MSIDTQPGNFYISHNHGDDIRCFVTATLKPKFNLYQSITQYEITHHYFDEWLSLAKTFVRSVELTKQGNVHYHAVYTCRDRYNAIHMCNKLKKIRCIGHFLIKNIETEHVEQFNNSVKYLYKDVKLTEKVLHNRNYKPPIIKTNLLDE